ncbi:MAG: hypothetical protein MK133_14535 [Planctomycetes bacterium]|nr:hypothetical protein [Planctomycetota bacterium]
MAIVHVPPQMQELTGGLTEVEAEGDSLRRLVANLDTAYPGFKDRLIKDDLVAPGLDISIYNVVTSSCIFAEILQDSVIHITPAISGGR